jgi:hypothetical protein
MKTPKQLSQVTLMLFIIFGATTISAQVITGKAAIKADENDRKAIDNFFKNEKAIAGQITTPLQIIPNYEKKLNLKNGYCTEADYKVPKKVAILTFYIQDSDYKVYGRQGAWSITTSYKSQGSKVNATMQLIYDRSIEGIKEKFANHNMEILTPSEYLTSGQLKQAYLNHPLPNLESRFSAFNLANEYAAIPIGYRFLPYNSVVGAQGKKFFLEKQAYFEGLDFDAFIVICVHLTAATNSVNAIKTSFHYKNPGWKASGKSGMIVGYDAYSMGTSQIVFKTPLKGLYIKEQEEFTNKKGKPDIKMTPKDVDERLSKLLIQVCERLAENAVSRIEGKKK